MRPGFSSVLSLRYRSFNNYLLVVHLVQNPVFLDIFLEQTGAVFEPTASWFIPQLSSLPCDLYRICTASQPSRMVWTSAGCDSGHWTD